MHVYIVYAHPSKESFTFAVLNEFCRGLTDAGHTYKIGDLYDMGFQSDMSLSEYEREMNVHNDRPSRSVPPDVVAEHGKIQAADGLAFIFPLWWSDCPAKLKGWFDRVWVCGYAYEYTYRQEEFPFERLSVHKALVMCPAGATIDHLEETGIMESLRSLYLRDRIRPEVGVAKAELTVLGGTAELGDPFRQANLELAYSAGIDF